MAVDKKSTCKPLDMAQLDSVFLGFRGEFQGLPQDVMLMELWSPLAKENEEPMTYLVLYSEFFWRVKEGTFGGSPPPSPKKITTPANYKVSCGPFLVRFRFALQIRQISRQCTSVPLPVGIGSNKGSWSMAHVFHASSKCFTTYAPRIWFHTGSG
jgi:hypothetical protein